MSISNPNEIDAMTVHDGRLIMLISDHLRWDAYQTAHLKMLQDKLNTYIRFIDAKGYEKDFPGREIDSFVIDVAFMHPYDVGFVRMVELVRSELDKRKIKVSYRIVKNNE